MMFRPEHDNAFTLIEIIVVLIIVGILAAIALPNLFAWIHKSRSAEAFATISSVKSQLTPCLAAGMEASKCLQAYNSSDGSYEDKGSTKDETIPQGHLSPNFSYALSVAPGGPGRYGWSIEADDPDDISSIIISGNSAGVPSDGIPAIICAASGVYQGIC